MAQTQTKLNKFFQLSKVVEEKRQVWGVATNETPDGAGEIMDYEHSRPHFEKWMRKIESATGGRSKGILRAMHQPISAGRIVDMQFYDTRREIYIGAEVVDDKEWEKVQKGVYTGFSIAGDYGSWSMDDGPYKRYEALPEEISLADIPCNPDAMFQVVKADGVIVTKNFESATVPERGDNHNSGQVESVQKAGNDMENEEPTNSDGQTEQEEKDEHNDVMSVLEAAIADGSEEVKALAEKIKQAIQADEAKEEDVEANKAEGEQETEQAPSASASADGETVAPDNREAMRAEIIGILEEVGLVERTGGAMKVTGADALKKSQDRMTKTEARLTELTKDLAKAAREIGELKEQIKRAGASGPVLREISFGGDTQDLVQKSLELEGLRKAFEGETNPNLRQAIGLKIAELEIKINRNKTNS